MERSQTPPSRQNLKKISAQISATHSSRTLSSSAHMSKIVWAVDAFSQDREFDWHLMAGETLQRLFPNALIVPVYVLCEDEFTDKGFTGFLKPALKPMARKKLEALIQNFKKDHFSPPRVLLEKSIRKESAASKLIRFAQKLDARFIALDSHARGALSRIFIGSFTEAVIDTSPLPVLVNGPKVGNFDLATSGKIEVLLFPTDFSLACGHAFAEILKFAKWLGAEVHLFHKPELSPDPLLQAGVFSLGGAWIPMEAYANQDPTDHQADAESWIRQGSQEGVIVRNINQNFREPTSLAIVEYLQTLSVAKAMIAMTTQTGPVASAFLGSVTRDVIKQSPCPVYLAPRIF